MKRYTYATSMTKCTMHQCVFEYFAPLQFGYTVIIIHNNVWKSYSNILYLLYSIWLITYLQYTSILYYDVLKPNLHIENRWMGTLVIIPGSYIIYISTIYIYNAYIHNIIYRYLVVLIPFILTAI